MLKRRKVQIVTGATVKAVNTGTAVHIELSDGRTFFADAVLVATGRLPNVEDIGLEEIGIDPEGHFRHT